LSSNRLVVISQVLAEASRAATAICLTRHEANLVLLLDDKTEVNVGTSLILVLSGNFMDWELYHTPSFYLTCCNLSVAHSIWKAYIFSLGFPSSIFLIHLP
jgi:hypothetical protein